MKKIISTSEDKLIKIIDFNTGDCLTLTGHQDGVNMVIVSNKKLISCSKDSTIKVWNVDNGLLEKTLEGHVGNIFTIIATKNNILYSGSKDTSVKKWDFLSGMCLHTYAGHTMSVNAIAVSDQYILTGGLDKSVKVWEYGGISEWIKIFTLENPIKAIQILENIAFIGSTDIQLWDILTGRYLRTLINSQAIITALQIIGDVLIASSNDGKIKFWDARSYEHLLSIDAYDSEILSLHASGTLFAANNAQMINIWKISI